MKHILCILIFLSAVSLRATPEFAAWTGNKCSTCHLSENGGGARNDFGFNFARDASFFTPSEIPFMDRPISNQLFGGLMTYGADFRLQSTRSSKVADAKRRYYPMQCAAYLAVNPTDYLAIESQVNIGPIVFEGQRNFAASLKLTPSEELPYLRVGYFQPAFGLKNPDMTDLDRRVAGIDGSINLFAPDFADLGVEIGYNSLSWLTLQVGLFNNQSLKKVSVFGDIVSLVPDNDKLVSSKIVIHPQDFLADYIQDFYFGYSNSICGNFVYNTAFVAVSPLEDLLMRFVFSHSNKPGTRLTHGYILDMSYIIMPGLFLTAKGQYGTNEMLWDKKTNEYLLSPDIKQLTLGARWFVMPHVEFLPEYRFMQSSEYKSWRWMFQLHLYF